MQTGSWETWSKSSLSSKQTRYFVQIFWPITNRILSLLCKLMANCCIDPRKDIANVRSSVDAYFHSCNFSFFDCRSRKSFRIVRCFLCFFFFLFETISDKHRIGHTFISAMKESIWWKVEDIDIRADNLGYSVVRKEREKRDKGFHFESIVGFIGKVFSFFFFF